MKSSIELFGNRVRELRKRNNMTQEQLAENLGVDAKTISRLEKGYYFTTYDNLEKLAKALNVEIKDFFDFEHLNKAEDLQKYITNKVSNMSVKELQKLSKFIRDFL